MAGQGAARQGKARTREKLVHERQRLQLHRRALRAQMVNHIRGFAPPVSWADSAAGDEALTIYATLAGQALKILVQTPEDQQQQQPDDAAPTGLMRWRAAGAVACTASTIEELDEILNSIWGRLAICED